MSLADYLPLLIQQLIASSTHLIAKSAVTTTDPRVVVLWRALFTVALFMVWLLFNKKKIVLPEKKDIALLVMLGIVNIPINQLGFISGIEFTTAPNSALLYALTPAFVIGITTLRKHEKLTVLKSLGVAVAFFGVCLVLLEKGLSFGGKYVIGDLMVLSASFSWALYTVFGRALTIKYGAIYVTGLTFVAGLLTYIPIFLLIPTRTPFLEVSSTAMLQIAYLGIVTSGIGYSLWYIALSKIPASKVAVFNNFQPILTTLLALLVFGDIPSPIFIIGGALTLVGVVLTQRS